MGLDSGRHGLHLLVAQVVVVNVFFSVGRSDLGAPVVVFFVGWIYSRVLRLIAAFLIHFPQLAPSREPYRPISGGPAIPSTARELAKKRPPFPPRGSRTGRGWF